MAEINARKQIIDKIDTAENILVTVSNNPSVDELAAALGLTVAINKSGKRATAVASGQMPDALQFLRPEKTFENTVDSLRDFIIALSKDKADHLRYKLVGNHVKIFITPYKTVISEKDLEFEQGDFNVDLVIALGVRNKNSLDAALAAHGRILHDASVGVVTIGSQNSNLSDLNWHSPNASSLSEVTLDLVNSLGRDSLTKTVATALLTGIVAETERFSNNKTSARVMNVASKLMLAGADQQLVVSKLKAAAERANEIKIKKRDDDNEVVKPAAKMPKQPETKKKQAKPANDGSLTISHDDEPEADDDNFEIIDDFDAPDETPEYNSEKSTPEIDDNISDALEPVDEPEIEDLDSDPEIESEDEDNDETDSDSPVEETPPETAENVAPAPKKKLEPINDISQPEEHTEAIDNLLAAAEPKQISEADFAANEDELEESLQNLSQQPQASDLLDDYDFTPTNETIDDQSIADQPAPQTATPAATATEAVAPAPADFTTETTQVNPPIENYSPEIPTEIAPPVEQTAFVAEEPIQAQDYQPASYTAPQISAHDQAPAFEQPAPQAENYNPEATTPSQNPDTYIRAESAAEVAEPTMGGTLNATTEAAAEAAEKAKNDERNKTILSHGTPGQAAPVEPLYSELPPVQIENSDQTYETPQPQYNQTAAEQPQTDYAQPEQSVQTAPLYDNPAPQYVPQETSPAPTMEQTYQAPAADTGFDGLPLPPPIPDFNTMPMPPLPDFGAQDYTPRPADNDQPAQGSNASGANIMTEAVYPADPSQFKIPGM